MKDRGLLMLALGGLLAAVYFLSKKKPPPPPTRYTSKDTSDIVTAIRKGKFEIYSVEDKQICQKQGVDFPCLVIVYNDKQGMRVSRYISQKDLEGLAIKAGKKLIDILAKVGRWIWGVFKKDEEAEKSGKLVEEEPPLTGSDFMTTQSFTPPKLTVTSRSA